MSETLSKIRFYEQEAPEFLLDEIINSFENFCNNMPQLNVA